MSLKKTSKELTVLDLKYLQQYEQIYFHVGKRKAEGNALSAVKQSLSHH